MLWSGFGSVSSQSIQKLRTDDVSSTALLRVLSFSELAEVMFEMKCGSSVHGLYTFDFCLWLTTVNTVGAISILGAASILKSMRVSMRSTEK